MMVPLEALKLIAVLLKIVEAANPPTVVRVAVVPMVMKLPKPPAISLTVMEIMEPPMLIRVTTLLKMILETVKPPVLIQTA